MSEIVAKNNAHFDAYYDRLTRVETLGISREEALRPAFSNLLDHYAQAVKWTLALEERLANGKRPDGTLYDTFKIPRGYWEAKDTRDDLEAEISAKIKLGYPILNTIFEDTRRAILYQNRQRVGEFDLQKPDELARLLTAFFSHTDERIEEYRRAVAEFSTRIPDLANGLSRVIAEQRTNNPAFTAAFSDFHDLCRAALNPQVRAEQIEEMLIQHLLTDRLFQNVFDNPEFTRRNVIAAEIEKVIGALTSQSFSKQAFLRSLDFFYETIEATARTISDWSQKQAFLNDVYERFFQDFSQKTADTHGIVYTPQEIVDFMCRSVEDILESEFGLSLSQEGVAILDPCTGTGNFLVNLLRRVSPLDLRRKYEKELFANEVMLLPYYVASLNIEHAYYELQKTYLTFPGLSFADTLDMADGAQLSMFAPQNLERVERQKKAPITVIIGNPPYNVGQKNENDNNKNRAYPIVDRRIKETYIRDSTATKTKAYDAYIRFFRWATDRLRDADGKPRNGIICFVSPNSFVKKNSFDGMRKNLLGEFDTIYHFDFKGDAHTSGENRRKEGGNIFDDQIRSGIGITLLVRNSASPEKSVRFHAVDDYLGAAAKKSYLKTFRSVQDVPWETLEPDAKGNWITEGMHDDFADFLPIGSKEAKAGASQNAEAIFALYSLGVSTNRDPIAYDFDPRNLEREVRQFLDAYNAEVDRFIRAGSPKDIDSFAEYHSLKWSRNLKSALKRKTKTDFSDARIRVAQYRPFANRFLYFDHVVVDELGLFASIFPSRETENLMIVLAGPGHRQPFAALSTDVVADLHALSSDGFQCFPQFVFGSDGVTAIDNVTDWAVGKFRAAFGDGVTRDDIFHYVYAVLHHPGYREKYAENLKRELPRVPLLAAESFPTLVRIGRELCELHVGYETAPEYPLGQLVDRSVPFSWTVRKMRLSADRTQVKVNDSLTLTGIPPDAFLYRLGNRSALEWVLDQYQISTDKRTGLVSDPNRAGDPEYIARLVRRVVTVSVETVRRTDELASIPLA